MAGLTNQRRITTEQIIRTQLLKWKFGSKLMTDGAIRILGKQPIFKLPGTKSKIVLGKKVVLNSDARTSNTALTYSCTLACGLSGIIEIGDNSMLNGVSITSYEKVSIGKNCQIASCTMISDTDFHPTNPEIRTREVLGHKISHSEVNKAPVIIGDNVWIGWGCIILKGVKIGNNSIIAAGSVVLKDVPANVLAAGNPAVIKKKLA
jgi:acetyltransferase-like isoleucine patch superfamily enzyme